ncbi:monocarboxylate transporter 13 isoform X2 [Strongylocentrotus purpuratus]|uniref:Major facilitator superfamily (MFS) profile domain-containing protein n=1 Tax=Strongylocentrotus purpuratus TaxID=7668 RepID=A0A7M7NK64_STRPU|nr:monocarboxylate transporter 13 isoform X2 [Strongylocentrotus purpuratus]
MQGSCCLDGTHIVADLKGAISGAAIHKLGARVVVIIGGTISTIGLLVSSVAPSPWVLYVSAGLLAGVGYGSTLNAITVCIAEYFTKYYSIAQSIASAGSAVGIILLPPLTQYLVSEYGWKGAYLVLAGLLANSLVCGMLLRPLSSFPREVDGCDHMQPEEGALKKDAMTQFEGSEDEDDNEQENDHGDVDLDEVTSPSNRNNASRTTDNTGHGCSDEYQRLSRRRQSRLQSLGGVTGASLLIENYRFSLIVFVLFFSGLCMSAIMTHLVLSVVEKGISEQAASFLMSFFGIGNLIGKIISAVLLGRKLISVTKLFGIAIFGWGISTMFLRVPTTYSWFIVVALSVGTFSGIDICTVAIVLKEVVGVAKLGRGFGVLMVFTGIGCLIGPVLGGWIYDRTKSFDISFFLFGALLAASSFSLLLFGKLKKLEDRHQRRSIAEASRKKRMNPEEFECDEVEKLRRKDSKVKWNEDSKRDRDVEVVALNGHADGDGCRQEDVGI